MAETDLTSRRLRDIPRPPEPLVEAAARKRNDADLVGLIATEAHDIAVLILADDHHDVAAAVADHRRKGTNRRTGQLDCRPLAGKVERPEHFGSFDADLGQTVIGK